MKSRNVRFAELLALIDRLHDEGLSEREIERLQDLAEQDPDALRAYVDYVDLQASLAWERAGAPRSRQGEAAPVTPRSPILGFLGDAARQTGALFTNPYRLSGVLLIAAVTFLLGLTAASQGLSVGRPAPTIVLAPSAPGAGRPQPESPLIAGRLVHAADAVWDKASGFPSVGDPLEADRVMRLRKGTAEIAFDSGARVLLKGPARFQLSSPMAGMLHYGSLVTDVPKEARGFVVETPRASIIDYGTSFFLSVDPKDKTEEAFVREGEIRVGVGDDEDDGPQTVKKLLKGQGVQIGADSGGKTVMREISRPPARANESELKALQPSLPTEVAGLRLWLRADAGVFQDLDATIPAKPGDHVARWIDQSGNGLSPGQRNALHRPQLVADAKGRFALQFSRALRQWLEEPAQTGPLSRVLDVSDRAHPQFTICATFATRASRTKDPQSLFGQFRTNSYVISRQFAIDRGGQLFYSEYPPRGIRLTTEKGTVAPNRVCVATLVRDGDTQSVHLDGTLLVTNDQGEHYVGNEPCRWRIGGRYWRSSQTGIEFFDGSLFELIVFSRALSEKTRQGIETYLTNRLRSQDTVACGPVFKGALAALPSSHVFRQKRVPCPSDE